jgi:hypothetical protein
MSNVVFSGIATSKRTTSGTTGARGRTSTAVNAAVIKATSAVAPNHAIREREFARTDGADTAA